MSTHNSWFRANGCEVQPSTPTSSSPSRELVLRTLAQLSMAISVPRPRILLVILLALVATLALFHPASPTHHSALSGSSSSSSSKYQKYPPALPHREGGGFFANGTSMSGAGRRQANAVSSLARRLGRLRSVSLSGADPTLV